MLLSTYNPSSHTEEAMRDYSPPSDSSFYNFSQTASTTQCLTITIFDDQIYEGTENFTGQLFGVLTDGVVVPNIPRLTIQPRQTTIQVTDDDGNVSLNCTTHGLW